MKARKILAASLLSALALSASACSSTSSNNGGGGDQTITFAIWDDLQEPAMKQIASSFESENPGVKVQVQLTPWDNYWDKLRTTVSAGNGPDVMWFTGMYFGLYASEGQLAPIEGPDLSKYPEGAVKMYEYGGKQYALPKDVDTVAMWYNKRLFKEAGLKEPGKGYTWEQMKKDAATLTKGDVKGFAASSASQQYLYPAIYSSGGTVIDESGNAQYNTPEAKNGVKFLKSFIEEGSSPTSQQMTDTSPSDAFGSGKIGMYWTQNTNAKTFALSAEAKNIDVAPLPAGPAGSVSVMNSVGVGVNAKSKHGELAQKFAAYVAGEKGAQVQAKAGTAIPAFTGSESEWLKSYPQFNLQVFLDARETAKSYPISVTMSQWLDTETKFRREMWTDKTTIDQGLDDLNAAVQKIIDEGAK